MSFARGVALTGHILVGLLLAAAVNIEGGHRLSRERLGGWWHRRLLRILHIRLRIHGKPLKGPRVVVSNHVSWLDIHIIAAHEPTRFVSKAEVRDWPIAGWFANASGTFYLERGAGGTRALIDDLVHHVPHGPITFFPEGTTTEGDRLLRFQPRLFAVAIEAGCPVQPVALRFGRAASGENIAPFVGEQALTENLWRLLREPSLDAELIYCAPISSRVHNRDSLAQATRASIAEGLGMDITADVKAASCSR